MKTMKVFFPRTRLTQMIARPGGLTCDAAVAKAQEDIEALRGPGEDAIDQSISAIEVAAYGARRRTLSGEQMADILLHADRVFTLAGTFGFQSLQTAARSLCDIAEGFIEGRRHESEPVAVHAQALRLLSPKAKPLSPENVDKVLAELARLLDHFEIAPLAEDAEAGEPAPEAAAPQGK